jgi:hypothetical protein
MSDDHWEISNLVARYAELLNLGRVDDVAALFEYGQITSENNPNVYEGVDGVTKMYRDSLVQHEGEIDTLLFTSNLQIELNGETAAGKAYFLAIHKSADDVAPVLAGRYHDQFRRIDGTWWFHHRHMFPDLQGDLSTHLTKTIEAFSQPAEG